MACIKFASHGIHVRITKTYQSSKKRWAFMQWLIYKKCGLNFLIQSTVLTLQFDTPTPTPLRQRHDKFRCHVNFELHVCRLDDIIIHDFGINLSVNHPPICIYPKESRVKNHTTDFHLNFLIHSWHWYFTYICYYTPGWLQVELFFKVI